MMEEALMKYGFPGVCLVALGWYILHLEKRHSKERKEWMDRTDQREKENTVVMREHNSLLSGIKTLLENRR